MLTATVFLLLGFRFSHPDKAGKSLLHEAAALGLHHLTAQLVARELDVNGADPENGWSPVHYACNNG